MHELCKLQAGSFTPSKTCATEIDGVYVLQVAERLVENLSPGKGGCR